MGDSGSMPGWRVSACSALEEVYGNGKGWCVARSYLALDPPRNQPHHATSGVFDCRATSRAGLRSCGGLATTGRRTARAGTLRDVDGERTGGQRGGERGAWQAAVVVEPFDGRICT